MGEWEGPMRRRGSKSIGKFKAIAMLPCMPPLTDKRNQKAQRLRVKILQMHFLASEYKVDRGFVSIRLSSDGQDSFMKT